MPYNLIPSCSVVLQDMISNAFDFLPEDYSPDSPFPQTPEAPGPNNNYNPQGPPIYDTPVTRRLDPPVPPPKPQTPPRTYKQAGAVAPPPPVPPPRQSA